MNASSPRRTVAIAAAAILLVSLRSLAGAATLESITVEPPVVHMRPCEVVLLEITGHYDDGTARDLELEFGLTFTFAEGIAQRSGTRTVVNNVGLDDVLTVSLDGVDSAPVPLIVITPEDRSRCVGGGTSTTTTTDPPSTTTSSTTPGSSTTTTTTTLDPSTPTLPGSSTTTTTLPRAEDPACGSCVRDSLQHRFRIEGHVNFDDEQLLQDRCVATEFPAPFFQVAADGTQSSIFDVRRVVEGSCQTTLVDPNPRILDESFQPIQNPDPDLFGVVDAIERRPDFVRFDYTHPTTPPDDGDKFRVVRIGIFYVDRSNPGPERLVTVITIHVYRPPVVMIHGLWSDATAFEAMEQSLAASNYEPFQLYRLDYRGTNDSAFDVNFPLVGGGIDAAIQQAADADLAAGKVDLVAHSMGGVISRLYVQDPGYQHEVRRIITSNTPHAGSQMANLLLDDPQGRICSLLSRLMSSDEVPNRGCANGAVDDMQVFSFATNNFLNNGIHPTEVAVHAVTTVFDLATLTNLPVIVADAAGPVPLLVAHVLRACVLSLFDSIFDSDENDLIVSATSQAGGLGGPLTSRITGQRHMGAAANSQVIERVKDLLNEPQGSSSFTHSGYSPGQLNYSTPSICPVLRRAKVLGAPRSVAATDIAITSPAPGTILTTGESFSVEVDGGADIATVVLAMNQPGDQMVIAEQPGPAAHFDLEIPETAIGRQNIVVAGLDAAGNLVAVSDTVAVDVVVPATLESVTVYPPVVYLRRCATASLEITGHYDDGIARDLSAHPGLGLSFATGNAVQSGVSGVTLNEALDDTLTVTFDGLDSAPVPIRALGSHDDAGSCGVGSTTTTTLPPSNTTTSSTTSLDPSTTTSTSTTTTPESSTTTTTTTTPETSTTTTLEPSTTTTTTLPAGCQADADCDDGDACTTDVCAPTGCEHAAAAGLAGAECLLSAALSEPLCPEGAMAPQLETFVTRKMQRALELVQEAAVATKPKRQQRLLDKAAKTLGRILRHKPGTTTQDCLQDLGAQIDAILDTL